MRNRILDALAEHVVIPVVREHDAERARLVVTSLRRAGFRVFEITLTVPGADALIRELAADPEVTVGVGTVFAPSDARRAIDAGASFVVTPATLPEVASATHEDGATAVIGALTPTEVATARDAGADAVKIFPVSSVGGPGHLKSIASVFPDVPLIPTGGVGLDDLHDYLEAGAHSVGVGGALTRGRDASDIEESARRYLAAADRTRPRTKENP